MFISSRPQCVKSSGKGPRLSRTLPLANYGLVSPPDMIDSEVISSYSLVVTPYLFVDSYDKSSHINQFQHYKHAGVFILICIGKWVLWTTIKPDKKTLVNSVQCTFDEPRQTMCQINQLDYTFRVRSVTDVWVFIGSLRVCGTIGTYGCQRTLYRNQAMLDGNGVSVLSHINCVFNVWLIVPLNSW